MIITGTGRAAAWLLLITALFFTGCDLKSPGDEDGETDEPVSVSLDGVWYKAWTSDYQYDSTPSHLCTAILAEYSGSSYTFSFYRDTAQVFGLRGTFSKSGGSSGTLSYTSSQMWDSGTKSWTAYTSTMTQTYSMTSSASTTVSDWAGVNQVYSKVTLSRSSALVGDWGGNADFGDGDQNSSTLIKSDGTYAFYQDGVKTQAGTWWSATSAAGAQFIRTLATEHEGATGIYFDYLTPYTISGSVMTMDQGSNPDYVATKATVLAGTVSTLAGDGTQGHLDDPTNGLAAQFNHPQGMVAVGDSLYVTDTIGQYIRKVSISTSAVSTIAGTGIPGFVNTLIPVGTNAAFTSPAQLATDGTYLYVADTGNAAVRRITLSGSYPVETYTAAFSQPYGIAVSGNYLYVADYADGIVYKLDKTNLSATAGTFCSTGILTSIRFLATDDTFLYLATGQNNGVIRISLQDASMESLVSGSGGHTDGYGSGTGGTPAADTYYPWGIAVDSNYLYYSEGVPPNGADTIRRVNLGTRYVDTLAGNFGTYGSADGTGTAATFQNPTGVCILNGVLYVADKWNHKIRKIQ